MPLAFAGDASDASWEGTCNKEEENLSSDEDFLPRPDDDDDDAIYGEAPTVLSSSQRTDDGGVITQPPPQPQPQPTSTPRRRSPRARKTARPVVTAAVDSLARMGQPSVESNMTAGRVGVVPSTGDGAGRSGDARAPGEAEEAPRKKRGSKLKMQKGGGGNANANANANGAAAGARPSFPAIGRSAGVAAARSLPPASPSSPASAGKENADKGGWQDHAPVKRNNNKKKTKKKIADHGGGGTAAATEVSRKPEAAAATEGRPAPAAAARPSPKKKRRTFQDGVYLTMLNGCRPYSLRTLAASTGSTEQALNSVMLSLVDKDLVRKKDFPSGGGARVRTLYWANQSAKGREAAAYHSAAPDEIDKARAELVALRQKLRSARTELEATLREPTNSVLADRIQKAEAELAALGAEAAAARGRIEANGNTGDPGPALGERCPRRTKMRINHMREEWVQRKLKCTDFLAMLADGLEKKVKDVVKMLEIETDEAGGVQIPPKYVLP